MTFNFLKLNEDKTEYIMFGTRHQLAKIEPLDIKVGPAFIYPVERVRNLGFYMENILKNHRHINRICSQLFCIIKSVQAVCSRLDHDTAKIIIQGLVLSKLEYCNSLLAGSAKYQLEMLQRVQNMTCRVVNNLRKYDHISASLMGLYWLKVRECIKYTDVETRLHQTTSQTSYQPRHPTETLDLPIPQLYQY